MKPIFHHEIHETHENGRTKFSPQITQIFTDYE
jgi:hypothetical protein